MAPISLKIVQGGGAVTRTLLFDTRTRVSDALEMVKERMLLEDSGKDYGLFLTSADDDLSGVWLEGHRTLDYYILRDGDSLQYLCKTRNLKVKMLDGSEKTMQIDESKCVGDLMMVICDKIGITNHEEYGLCFDEEEVPEEKPATGTLTLKRKLQTREKDAQLEELSKKLKTDDNVEWLAQHKTLREIGVEPRQTVLLKRRLFYSDRNVDSRDPVQLNLLYVQTRDAILDGRQVLTEDKAIEFAGIQCQVQYGDFQEEKHKPGFIENLKEFLPEQYADSWGSTQTVERKVFKEHSKHSGLSPLEAKHLYTKNARELPTYGVTFFLVKEQQKGKKKLVPRLLGINAESILRLDEVTKEILQVWMLTQVKTFRAGKEMFTLDFGDYSDKEYTVKTNEAYRIRDILQGYIDIVHRSVAAPFNVSPDEGQAIYEDNVQSSTYQIIENFSSMQTTNYSFVGPSSIIPDAHGTEPMRGTHVTTIQQMTVTNKGSSQQRGIAGVRRNNSLGYLKKLNRLNSNSVETVGFLTEPQFSQVDKVKKVKRLAAIIEEDMNDIIEGVHKSVENDNEDVRRKILSELDELCASFQLLIGTSSQNDFGTPASLDVVQEAAEKIVGHGTQLHCSLDPGIKRRSNILRRSHKSFIADEKTEATLRRASFLSAASHACQAIDRAREALDTASEVPLPEAQDVDKLEREARRKIGKLSAAIALLMSAQADSNNIDYTAAITSMTTIDELLPELIQDAKALNGRDQRSLINKMKSLCDAARSICALTGDEDKEQMQELAFKYAKASDKLIFTFGRGSVPDKENEILDLAKDVGDKTTMLLMKAHELNNLVVRDPRASDMESNMKRCDDDSKTLLTCAQLTASSITEPHCQSAMTAAAEALASSTQRLAATWKPLAEEPGRRMFEESLLARTMDLMKALDRLKDAYTDLSETEEEKGEEKKERERLKYIASMKDAVNNITNAQKQLDKPTPEKGGGENVKELQRVLGQRLSALNAYVATLIRATSDPESPDYVAADEAIALVSEVIPHLVQDVKTVSATKDDNARRALMNEIRALCEATRDVCTAAENSSSQDVNDAAARFARHSSKLCYAFIPRADPRKENKIMELSKRTCEQASQLLTHVNQLVDEVGGAEGQRLDLQGAKLVDVVQALLTTAQITAPSCAEARCWSTLQAAADDVSSTSHQLANTWSPLVHTPGREELRRNLDTGRSDLETALNNLKTACENFGDASVQSSLVAKPKPNEEERLKFIATLASHKRKMLDAEKNLEKPTPASANQSTRDNEAGLKRQLTERLARLNAAIASLVRATADCDNVDYTAAEQSLGIMTQLLPDFIHETRSLCCTEDDSSQLAMLSELQKLFEATRNISQFTEHGDAQAVNETALKFAEASRKLHYIFNPRPSSPKEDLISELSADACDKATKLLTNVNQLAELVGGDDGNRLDDRGVRLVNAAKTMLTTSQILGPSLGDTNCKSMLLSTIDDVSAASRELGSAWTPIKRDPKYKKSLEIIERERKELDEALHHLRAACNEVEVFEVGAGGDHNVSQVIKSRDEEADRLKFVATMASTKNKMVDAEMNLQMPTTTKVHGEEAVVMERQLAHRLALLNAAIASLVRATTDSDNLDYNTAEQSISTITELLPAVIDNTQSLSYLRDDEPRRAMLSDLKKLFETTRSICQLAEQGDAQGVTDSALRFADASRKLCYVFNPQPTARHAEKSITELSADACDKASKLLANVNHLAELVGGDDGNRLDDQGVKLVNAAKALLTTAQILEPSLGESQCKTTLLSTIDNVSAASQDLGVAWTPMKRDPKYKKNLDDMEKGRRELESALDNLRMLCETTDDKNIPESNEETVQIKKRSVDDKKVAPHVNAEIANLNQLCKDVYNIATDMADDANTLANLMEGEEAEQLMLCGEWVVDAANELYSTVAVDLHSPIDRRNTCAVPTAIEGIAASSMKLADGCRPVRHDPAYKEIVEEIERKRKKLDSVLRIISDSCTQVPHVSDQRTTQWLTFISDMSDAKNELQKTSAVFQQPVNGPEYMVKLSDLQQRAAKKLASLNAAVASLILAASDQETPEAATAKEGARAIIEGMPDVVNDLRLLSTSQETEEKTMQQLKKLYDAVINIFEGLENGADIENATKSLPNYVEACRRLRLVINPDFNLSKEKEIEDLSRAACERASQLLGDTKNCAESDTKGDWAWLGRSEKKVENAVQKLLITAEINALTVDDAGCKSMLLASIDNLSTSIYDLSARYRPLVATSAHHTWKTRLDAQQKELDATIIALKAACETDDAPGMEKERLKFISHISAAKNIVLDAAKELDKPAPKVPAPGPDHQGKLTQRLAQLNAAIASLLRATDSNAGANYNDANEAVNTISECLPQIIRDSKFLAMDDAARQDMSDTLKSLCEATHDIYLEAERGQAKNAFDSITKLVNASSKLSYVYNTRADLKRENLIIELSKSVCDKASVLLTEVYALAESAGGEEGARLDRRGADLVDAAQLVLSVAQLTASFIDDPNCQSLLLKSADEVSSMAGVLDDTWSALLQDPQRKSLKDELTQMRLEVDTEIAKLKTACRDYTTLKPMKPSVPKRIQPVHIDSNHEEEKRQLDDCVDSAVKSIDNTEEEIRKTCDVRSVDIPSSEAIEVAAQQLEKKLALANIAASHLVMCNDPEKINYKVASKSVVNLSELFPTIVTDTKELCNPSNPRGKSILEDVLALCQTTKALCSNAQGNNNKLNETAVEFANKSTKLMYEIESGVDPEQERQVISRAKVIGDCASRLATCGAAAAQSAHERHAQPLCDAGSACADAASKLLYVTKLTAPFIQHPESQSVVLTVADQLSAKVKHYSSIWTQLALQPEKPTCIKDLEIESKNLEKLLSDLKHDVKNETLVKRTQKKTLKVENSPMRQLALEILLNYKSYVESPDLPMEERRKYAQEADKLSAALSELDVANAHSKLSPEDKDKLRAVENASQDLQRILLQGRRAQGADQTNVVDLMDFVKDVVSNIEAISKTAQETNGDYGRKELQYIKEECARMSALATEMTGPSEPHEHEGLTDDLLRINAFALGCEKIVPKVTSATRNIDDSRSRKTLQIKLQALSDSVNLLRFAVKGALATADSAALDESLHDLTDLENKIDRMLNMSTGDTGKKQYLQESSPAVAALCCVAASPHSSAPQLAPALAAYVTDLRMRTDLSDPKEKQRLEKHLRKLLLLLRVLMITTSRRIATWHHLDAGEEMEVTDQIIQELEEFEDAGRSLDKKQHKVIDNVDVRRLLLPPGDCHLHSDKNELKKKFHQTALKLDSMIENVASTIHKPQILSKSLHTTADTAIELGTLARALRSEESPIQSHRIENSAKEMYFATFNLLKVTEQVSQEPDSLHMRRRLLDAIRSLNNSIKKLSRATGHNEDGKDLLSGLKLQQDFLQRAQPTCALGYARCVEAVQHQSDIIYKLKNEQSMSREEGYSALQYITASVNNTAEYAVQCAYLISISDKYKDVAREGLPDVLKIQELTDLMQNSCVRIMSSSNMNQIKDLQSVLNDHERQLQVIVNECRGKVTDLDDEQELLDSASDIKTSMKELHDSIQVSSSNTTQISSSTLKLLDAIATLNAVIKRPTLLPKVAKKSEVTSVACDEVLKYSRELLNKTVTLVNETNNSAGGVTSWKAFDGSRTALIQVFDALANSIKENGRRVGLLESSHPAEEEDTDVQKKSHVELQLELAKKWLQKPTSSEEVKTNGIEGVRNVLKIAEQMVEELKDEDREEMRQAIDEVEKLSMECSLKYDKQKSSVLLERLLELRKMLERFVVTRVVEDFLEDGTALDDLVLLVQDEKDEVKRKYLLELKIAELLAQMGRVTRTARLAAGVAPAHVGDELTQCSQQVELLAPSLVKATQERINSPQHQAIIDKYKALMAQYNESMSEVRILCDRSVDPVDFVQAAGETMHRMREHSSLQDDPLKSANTSNVITKLGWRVLEAGMSSNHVLQDPDLKRALKQAHRRLQSVVPGAGSRASLQRNWKDVTAEILRTTSEVEAVLNGESIFQKQQDTNQPIFAAALDLHAAVREWSARDNEIVGVAKRMAVLMARLSDYMNQDKKQEVIVTSKAIVKASSEVAALARKLALECSDLRIRTNLMQVCDRIPTISGQLKMLTTVKGSSFGKQGNQEDVEAFNMLVCNAQNLMQSIQEVVAAAASASVKIMSQRGPKIRWVRKNYYNY